MERLGKQRGELFGLFDTILNDMILTKLGKSILSIFLPFFIFIFLLKLTFLGCLVGFSQ